MQTPQVQECKQSCTGGGGGVGPSAHFCVVDGIPPPLGRTVTKTRNRMEWNGTKHPVIFLPIDKKASIWG